MAEYKRKRRSSFKTAPKVNKKRIKRTNTSRDIEMTSQQEQKPHKNMRVVKGKKLEAQRRLKITALLLGVIAVVLILCQLIMPAGLLETVSAGLATIGAGSYPVTLEGSDTVNVVTNGSHYYVLSSSSVEAFSNAGKRIFSYNHGFENPVLRVSKTRALVFDQGQKSAYVFTLSGLESTITLKQEIKNGAIGDNGTYAFVTSSDNYAAQVSVFKKNNELVYEWFSSKDLVNNVAVAPSGKKIAVTTVSSQIGKYNSRLYVLNFKSATPEHEKTYENTVVYALDTSFMSGFSVLTANEYNFIKWSNFKIREYKNEYSTAMFRVGNNGVAVVYNRENDKTDNRIAVFSSGGKLISETAFKGIITDVALRNQHIYCASDTKAYILNKDGSVLRSGDCGFGVAKICPIGQNTMLIVTDNMVDKIELEQE